MDWREILIMQAITTVIAIAKSGDGKGKFRPALMKVFRTISALVATDAEIAEVFNATQARK